MERQRKDQRKNGSKIFVLEQLIKMGNPITAISFLKQRGSDSQLRMLPYFMSKAQFQTVIAGIPFNRKVTTLGKAPLLLNCNLERELKWESEIISMHSKEVADFLVYESNYSKLLLSGRWNDALGILDKIEEEFGISLWLIENRLAILQDSKGFEAQKDFMEVIGGSEDVNIVTRALTYFYSMRAEANVSVIKYNNSIEEEFLSKVGNVSNSWRYKFSFFFWEPAELEKILNQESKFSLIDRYLTFIRCCQIACDIHGPAIKSLIKRLLQHLESSIEDYRISNILRYLGESQRRPIQNPQQESIFYMLDQYTEGAYASSMQVAHRLLLEGAAVITAAEILVKSRIRTSSDCRLDGYSPVIDRILSSMHEIILEGAKSSDARMDLWKLCHMYPSQNWIIELASFLSRTNAGEYRKFRCSRLLGHLNSDFLDPQWGEIISDNQVREQFYKKILEGRGSSSTCSLLSLYYSGALNPETIASLNIPAERKAKYLGHTYAQTGNYQEAIDLYTRLIKSTDPIVRKDAGTNLTHFLLENGSLEQCLNLAVSLYLENANYVYRVPLVDLLAKIETTNSSALLTRIQRGLSLSIAYDAYSKKIATDRDTRRADAFEDFLEAHGLNCPSETRGKLAHFELNQLVYFLYYVCVPQVMDSASMFEGTDHLENERIAICQLLGEIDVSNRETYSDEIKKLTHRIMIRKGIHEIERSKIYVDVEGIKKSSEKNLREQYARYTEFASTDLATEPLIVIVNRLLKSQGGKNPPDIADGNEKFLLFARMFLELRDKFVSSNEHGLDGYLSVGIRHGTLSGQLRGPLEAEKVITTKDKETDIYRDNEYWAKILENTIGTEKTRSIIERLNEFSRGVDDLIDLLKNKWIQIRHSTKNPDGLFDYQFKPIELRLIEMQIKPTTTYDEFVEMSLNKLWEATEINLATVQQKISTELKELFNKHFLVLQQEINSYRDQEVFYRIYTSGIPALHASINRARIAVNDELDRIAGWFKLSKSSELLDYEISLAIDMALEQIRNIYPMVVLQPNKEIKIQSGVLMRGATLKIMTDILFILFDNVIKHSALSGNIPVEIECHFKNDGTDRLCLKIKNKVGDSLNFSSLQERLLELRSGLKDQRAWDSVRREGGTGFFKIAKFLRYDISGEHIFDFDFTEDNHFEVNLELAARKVVCEDLSHRR